jgi:hypothetical protein
VNPRRIPQTAQRRNTEIKHAAVDIAMAIIFQSLLDCGLVKPQELKEVLWPKVEYLSESISEGRVNVHDMINCLQDEYGILL